MVQDFGIATVYKKYFTSIRLRVEVGACHIVVVMVTLWLWPHHIIVLPFLLLGVVVHG